MKQIIKRGSFLTLMFMLLGCLSLYAADNALITKQITIKLEKAGTLPDRIASSEKYKITNLKIIGEINGTDLLMIRDMAGRNYTGNSTDGKLSVLDLSEAKIVKGGDYYYQNKDYNDNNNYYYTSNDVIGSYAFYDCSGLTSLTLPAGITEIGSSAFAGCSGLTSLTLPDGITSIGSYAFYDCSGLTSLTIPAGITSIHTLAFQYCSGLKEVRICINDNLDTYLTKGHPYIPVDYKYIDCDIKYYINDKEITSIEIPSNVTTLGDYVFQGRRGLTSLNLPAGITKIGEGAFDDCSGLTSLTLPAGITEIGYNAFAGCSGLTSLNLPAGITSIGSYTFSGCSGLTSLTLPAGITKIGEGAFYGCSGLTSLNLPAGITEIGSSAFAGCSGLTSLTIPAGITDIGYEAFLDCSGLTSLTLPTGISTGVDYGPFNGCSGLTSIYVYAEKVPKIGINHILDINVFEGIDAKKCTLYVPMGTYSDYWLSGFGDYFENIVEFDATGIDKTTTSNDVEEVARYSVKGQRLSAPTKGLNIVKYSDGSVKKVAVQ